MDLGLSIAAIAAMSEEIICPSLMSKSIALAVGGTDAKRHADPKYIGRLMHDFRRSCAYETWKAGSSVEDRMKVTGHATASMFKRYGDLFSKEEEQARQQEVQNRRREWKVALAAKVITMPKAAVQ